MPTLVRLLSSPLLSVGALVFDAELGVARGQQRRYSKRRIAAGATLSEHSRVDPRAYTVTGCVSAVPQPQNLGRPSPDVGAQALAALQAVGTTLANNLLPLGLATRLDDFEDALVALVDLGEEVEVITKAPGAGGRFLAVVTDWSAASSPQEGDAATYTLHLEEVQRAGGLNFGVPTLDGLSLNGSGQTTTMGPTQATDLQVDLLP